MSAPDATPISEALLDERAWVHALARRLVRDEADADDLEQETWRAALERPPPERRSVRGWLATVMYRLAGRARRAGARRDRRERAGARREAVPSTAALVAEAELHRRLVEAVLALNEPFRSTVLARYVHGLTPRELAARSGESVHTVASRLARGLASLRARLDADGRGDRRAWALVLTALDADVAPEGPLGSGASGGAAIAAAAGGLGMATSTKGVWVGAALLIVLAAGAAWFVVADPFDGDGPEGAGGSPPPGAQARGGGESAPALAAGSRGSTSRAVAPAADTSIVRLRGRVVDEEGRPVLGAVVTAAAADAFRFVVPADDATAATTAPAGRTSADGTFDIAVDDRAPRHLLCVNVPGRAPFVEGPVAIGRDTTIVLRRGERWAGRVVDEVGAPIAGATVHALLAMPWFRVERSTASDARGEFALDAMPGWEADRPGRFPAQAWVEATAPGRAPAALGVSRHDVDRAHLELVLRRGAALTGRVVDAESGEPVPDASVALRSLALGHGWMQGSPMYGGSVALSPFQDRSIAVARTDADGGFSLANVPVLDGPRPPPVPESEDRRSYAGRLVVSAAGRATAIRFVRRVEDGGVDVQEVRLWRASSVRGRIEHADRTPAIRLRGQVELGPPVAARVDFVTDDEGRFVATEVPTPSSPTDAEVTVTGPSGVGRWPVTLRRDAEVDAGVLTLPVPSLPPGVEPIAVRVVRADGAPVRGAWLHVVSAGGGRSTEVEVDRDGRATLYASDRGRGADGAVEIRCWAPGYARAAVRAGRGGRAAGDVVAISLVEGRPISGRVVQSDGTPAVRALVRGRRAGDPSRPMPASTDADDPEASAAATDDDGRFTLHDLAPGPWTLAAVASKARPDARAPVATRASVEAGTVDVELRLPAELRGQVARIEFVVVDDASGASIPGARVELRPIPGEPTAAAGGAPIRPWPAAMLGGRLTDPLVAPEVAVGAWSLRVWADGYATTRLDRLVVTAETTRVDLRVRRGSARAVRVTGPPRDETPRELRFLPVEAEREVRVVIDADGEGKTRALEPGTYRPTWGALTPLDRDTGGTTRVRVAADLVVRVGADDDPVQLTLVPGGVLSVDVDDPRLPGISGDRDPAAVARSAATTIALYDERGRLVARQQGLLRGRQGALDLVAVLPGRYRVRLELPDEAPLELEVDVAAGDHVLRTFSVGR